MSKSKTTQCAFYSVNPEGDKLFAIQPGVNVVDALEAAGNMLSSAIDIIYRSESASSEVFGAAYLAEFARETVSACIADLMKRGRS